MSDNVTSDEEIAQFAAQLNHPHLERQIAAAEDISLLLGGDRPDEALLGGIIHHKGALKGLLRLLHAGNDETWEIAFNVLFMLSMSEPERPFACPAHSANRTLIGEAPGIFEAFVTALNTAASEARNAALNALMSISFDNANNCLLIAHTSGMLQSLLKGLYSGSDESRDGFCGVLCNVIYYNKEATRLVLGCDNVLSMLNGLCKSTSVLSKYLGVSVLEACCHQEHAVPLLRQAHAVEALKEAMTSVHEETQDEAIAQAQATRLAAMMAISRLEHPKDLYSLRICDEILKDGVDVFRSSLQGRAWGNPSIIFLPIDCLSSLANVSRCPGNRPALIGTRVLSCYSALLSKWLAQRDDGKALADICAELVLCSGDVEEQHAELELDDRELDDDELATSVPHALAEGDMVAQGDDFFVVAYGQIVEDVEESESDEGEGDGEEEEVNEDADDVDEDVEQEHESSTNAKMQDINEINWLGGMTVTGPVTKIELEFAVAAIGSLAFLPPTAAAAASSLDSATTTDSAHASSHAGYHSQSHARPFADFSRHSTLLPLLKSIGEYCHWRSPDSVAASCLDWRAWYMEERSLAILMGLHIRLAQSSVMRLLDDNTVSLVLKEACTVEIAAWCLAQHLGSSEIHTPLES